MAQKSLLMVENKNKKIWVELGKLVIERREQLGIAQQKDVLSLGGPGSTKMNHIEQAMTTKYRRSLLLSLERALQWQPNSIVDFIENNGPAPKPVSKRQLQIVKDEETFQSQLNTLAQRLSRIEELLQGVVKDSK